MRILLVDDDTVFTDLISSKLAELGFDDLTITHSAEDALMLVDDQRLPFDCYLLDIMLGEMDGIELCRQLRERRDCRTAPIIMITSSADAPLMERAFDAGATDFMRKPLDHSEMIGRINTAMLLVDTTRKEKRGRDALRALISQASDFNLFDPAERVCFPDVNGMVDYYQIENRLLKMQDGQYQMTLFRVRIRDFFRLNRLADRTTVMQQLHAVSTTIAQTVTAQRFMLSYIGHGRFVCCILGRHSMVPQLFQSLLRKNAQEAFQDFPASQNLELTLDMSELSSNRILSRDAALSLLAKEQNAPTSPQSSTLPDVEKIEDRIFAKIKEEEHKLFGDR